MDYAKTRLKKDRHALNITTASGVLSVETCTKTLLALQGKVLQCVKVPRIDVYFMAGMKTVPSMTKWACVTTTVNGANTWTWILMRKRLMKLMDWLARDHGPKHMGRN